MSSQPPELQSEFPGFPIHYPSVPYTSNATHLQTLSLYLPRPISASDPETTIWLIYVHGGAWRDPSQTNTTIEPTLSHLHSTPGALDTIAGIASLNYRLSPYPAHPTSPSTPTDPARNIKHPEHVRDVEIAIRWLGRNYNLSMYGERGYKWIGIGHSCGATLLMQLISGIGIASDADKETRAAVAGIVEKRVWRTSPSALILMAGIYDLELFLKNHSPPQVNPEIAQVYRDIVEGAFDLGEPGWNRNSPAVSYGKPDDYPPCPLRYILLAHSPFDELVEMGQRDVMLDKLRGTGWRSRGSDGGEDGGHRYGVGEVVVRDLAGEHDFVWQDGTQVAELIAEVVKQHWKYENHVCSVKCEETRHTI